MLRHYIKFDTIMIIIVQSGNIKIMLVSIKIKHIRVTLITYFVPDFFLTV